MKKEPVVDYMDAVAQFSRELRVSGDEKVVLPESAGEQAVDYMTVSDLWKEVKAGKLRPVQASGQEGD